MRPSVLTAATAIALLSLFMQATAIPAKGDELGQRITVTVAPVFNFATGGDDNAPPPPGYKGIGYTKDHPIAQQFNLDYGVDFKLSEKFHLSFSHGNVAYSLGRILTLAPLTSFVSGALTDYTDTIALSYAAGHGVVVHGTYFNHQRVDVTGLCLNQEFCPVNGEQEPNPLSIDEHGYTLGATYDFGPNSRLGKILTVAFDIKYVPRPSTPSSPNVALGGLGHYVGTQTVFPFSVTVKIPVFYSTTFTPFINYTNLPVLYRDSAVPEEYRGIVWGFSKVFSKNVTFSYTNLNLQSCRCVDRVPPPDNLRLAWGIIKLDFHTQL